MLELRLTFKFIPVKTVLLLAEVHTQQRCLTAITGRGQLIGFGRAIY